MEYPHKAACSGDVLSLPSNDEITRTPHAHQAFIGFWESEPQSSELHGKLLNTGPATQ